MRIASQHKWKDADYSPHHAWSDETRVQWGSSGVVIGGPKAYTTAFFEAFPPDADDAGGFIRGEGKTIADAENSAFEKYRRGKECNHLWGREHYRNSGQLCRHCRAFRSGFVKDVFVLGQWRTPLTKWDVGTLQIHEDFETDGPNPKYIRLLKLRLKLFGQADPTPPATGE